MTDPLPSIRLAESVVHPSDFSGTSEIALSHALAIALRCKSSLTILHAGTADDREHWAGFPSIRGILEKWGRLEQGSPRSAVYRDLSVRVKKVSLPARRPLGAILNYLEEHPVDLVVVATEGREGLPRWLRPSVAEGIARSVRGMTLFVPATARGFVSGENGGVRLRKVLVPIDRDHDLRVATHRAAAAASMSDAAPVEVILFHAGPERDIPRTDPPTVPGCNWAVTNSEGPVVEEILRTAEENAVELIVMPTKGHDGFLDALRGSVTEQVVRRAGCPVLAVPEHPLAV